MKLAGRIALGVLLVGGSFVAGARWAHRHAGPASPQKAVVAYACPMHPQYRSDRPGDCPSCGMRLEPVHEDGGAKPAADDDGKALPAGAVRVTPERQQTIGVRLGVVERVSGTRTLRTTGRVAPNENAVYPLVAGADGVVREVRGATTGSLVKRNEVLLSFFAPEFVNAQISYFAGLDTLNRVSNVGGVERFANALRNLGVSELQLAELQEKRQLVQYIQIRSPVDGFVLERKAAVGLSCNRVSSSTASPTCGGCGSSPTCTRTRRRSSRRVEGAVHLPGPESPGGSHGEPLGADLRRGDAHPQGAAGSRQSRPRAQAGMFVDVRFDIELPPSLAVPADAIVDSACARPSSSTGATGTSSPVRSRRAGASATRWRSARG